MIGRWKFTGFFAWLLWLFIHLMYLVAFVNRLLVFIQWSLELLHLEPKFPADHRGEKE